VDLEWSDPTSDGGCPLSGFSIYRDDGAGGSYTEVHAASLNGNPSLSNFQITNLPASPIGKTVRFYMAVYN
jgi:hypothetical protein